MSTETLAALTPAEARDLTDAVKGDSAALWSKLLRLYEGQAHRALGYASWGAYFVAEFEASRSYGYRLLQAARTHEALAHQSPIGDCTSPPPMTEFQARELAGSADPSEAAETWQAAQARFGPQPTAAQIAQTRGHSEAPVVLDTEALRRRSATRNLIQTVEWAEVTIPGHSERAALLGKYDPELCPEYATVTAARLRLAGSLLLALADEWIDIEA